MPSSRTCRRRRYSSETSISDARPHSIFSRSPYECYQSAIENATATRGACQTKLRNAIRIGAASVTLRNGSKSGPIEHRNDVRGRAEWYRSRCGFSTRVGEFAGLRASYRSRTNERTEKGSLSRVRHDSAEIASVPTRGPRSFDTYGPRKVTESSGRTKYQLVGDRLLRATPWHVEGRWGWRWK